MQNNRRNTGRRQRISVSVSTESVRKDVIAAVLHSYGAWNHKHKSRLDAVMDIEGTIEGYDHKIKLHPRNPDIHMAKGLALCGLARYSEALEEFDKAIKLGSRDHEMRIARGMALFMLGRYSEAMEEYDSAIRSDPGDSRLHFARSILLRSLGREDAAEKEREAAMKIWHRNRQYKELMKIA